MAKMTRINAPGRRALPANQPPPQRSVTLKEFECGIHAISYMGHQAGCPVCHLERDNQLLRDAVNELKTKLAHLTDESTKLRVQVDIVAAIREASQLLNDEDLEFLKVVLYQWRDEKSVSLKTTHAKRKKERKGEPLPVNGFIVMPRSGDPYGHLCTSVGGVAIAEYYEEAVNTVGSAQATAWLVKGLAAQLPGVTK